MLKSGKTTTSVLIAIFAILLIVSAYYSYNFFHEKKNAEKYQELVETGVIEQGDDIDLKEYDVPSAETLISSGSSGGGGGGGGSSGGGGGDESPPGENMPPVLETSMSFDGMWVSDNDEGGIGGIEEYED